MTYRNLVNLGEYANRNKAVGMSSGEYIYFIDGDDLILYRGIEDSIKEIVRFPDCGLAVVRTENPKYIGPIVIGREDALNLEFFGGGVLNSSLANNIFKASILKEHLFFTQFKNADRYSRINLLRDTNLLVLSTPIAIWRLTTNQTSNKISVQRQYWEYLKFCKDELFVRAEYSILNQTSLKRIYYRVLLTFIIKGIKNINLNPKEVNFFFLDNFLDMLKYFFEKPNNEFWEDYNYTNINIYFKQVK